MSITLLVDGLHYLCAGTAGREQVNDVALPDVQRITRCAGKELFLHGNFGSKRITFSDKLKRDECIHLITSQAGAHVKVTTELE